MTTQHTRITRTMTAPRCTSVPKVALRAYHPIAQACAGAAWAWTIALALIVTLSLPAAFGFDPLGLVATGSAETPQAVNPTGGQPGGPPITPKPGDPVTLFDTTYKVDAIELYLVPGQFVEYKFDLRTGATMVFNWTATAPVDVDFHTVPEGKPIDASETFMRGSASSGAGTYAAPYPGLHGWYWLNTGTEPVRIILNAAGFFTEARMFSGDPVGEPMEVRDPPPPEF